MKGSLPNMVNQVLEALHKINGTGSHLSQQGGPR